MGKNPVVKVDTIHTLGLRSGFEYLSSFVDNTRFPLLDCQCTARGQRLLDQAHRSDGYFIVLVFPTLIKYSSGINSGFL